MGRPVSTPETVSNIIHVHSEIARFYRQTLHNDKEMGLDIRSILERIIETSIKCHRQLNEKLFLKAEPETKDKEIGIIKLPLSVKAGSKEILATCLQNELAVLNAYSTALSFTHDEMLKKDLQAQQNEIKQLHAHIKSYHDAL